MKSEKESCGDLVYGQKLPEMRGVWWRKVGMYRRSGEKGKRVRRVTFSFRMSRWLTLSVGQKGLRMKSNNGRRGEQLSGVG